MGIVHQPGDDRDRVGISGTALGNVKRHAVFAQAEPVVDDRRRVGHFEIGMLSDDCEQFDLVNRQLGTLGQCVERPNSQVARRFPRIHHAA